MKVSIITVGMNHLRYIKSLYRTLLVEHRPKCEFECIYVDNCSKDGSVQWLKDTYPEVKIIQNEVPLGFGENNNKGVAVATGEYVGIVNPDIEFFDDAIDQLVAWMDGSAGEYGIVGPKLLNPDRSIQYSARTFITARSFFYRALSRGNDDTSNSKVGDYLCRNLDMDKLQPVNWIMGAAMFATREFYNELGGFDEDYFLYMEDEDLCLRSWKAGRPVIFAGNIAVVHNHLRGSRKIGKKMMRHFQSLFTFFRKHGLNVKNYVKDR